MANESKQRKDYIDVLRAVAILFVVLGHCVKGWTEFFVFTSPIKMPLFFVISGFVFSFKKGSILLFYKNLLFRLIVPWLCLDFLPLLLQSCFLGSPSLFLKGSIDLLLGNKSWFMSCFILSQTIFFYILLVSRRSIKKIILYSILIAVFGFLWAETGMKEYSFLYRPFTVIIFYLFGFLLRNYESIFPFIEKKLYYVSFVLYLTLGILSILFFPNKCLDVHKVTYYNVFICSGMIFLGCFTLFGFAQYVKFYPHILTFIGRNTLVIYLTHSWFFIIYDLVFKPLFDCNFYIEGFIKSFFSLFCCLILVRIINKWIPVVAGVHK